MPKSNGFFLPEPERAYSRTVRADSRASMNVLAYSSFTIIPTHGNCAQPILQPHLHLKTGHSRAAPSVTAAVDSIATESVTADSSTTTDSVTRRADTSFFQRALILLHVQPIPPNPNQARKGRNAMLHNLRIHSRHIIIRPRDNIDELIKQGH